MPGPPASGKALTTASAISAWRGRQR
jgi:hypothetical protein